MNIQKLEGNWIDGWALDVHTRSSVRMPDGTFCNDRTDLGEQLYRLKYQGDRSMIGLIVDKAFEFLEQSGCTWLLDAVVPIPSSDPNRTFQPLLDLATELGRRLGIPAPRDYLVSAVRRPPIKNVMGRQDRRKQIAGTMKVTDARFAGKWVLLFDDIFDSGVTANEAAWVLRDQGRVEEIHLLTITKTRTGG
ncbi:MAG: ComF family protein [Anaerolineae bacterium]|jgi:competence protein ComFC